MEQPWETSYNGLADGDIIDWSCLCLYLGHEGDIKMKVYLCNYATPNFEKSQDRLNNSASEYVDKIYSWSPKWLKDLGYYEKNKALFDNKKGGGFYAWKPCVVYETLRIMKDGDILFYCDSGIEILRDINDLIHKFDKDFFFFKNPTKGKNFTKRDCFISMECDNKKAYDSNHVVAGFIGIRKSKDTMEFIEQWMNICQVPHLINDDKSGMAEELKSFIQHTHDQSILSLLVFKNNIKSYPITVNKGSSLFYLKGDSRPYLNVHRQHDRGFIGNIIYPIKLMIPSSIKNKLKMVVNRI